MIIEPANADDLATLITMRREASEWLAARGINQWQTPWPTEEAMTARIAASIEAGETWMVRDQAGNTAATVTLDTFANPQLWTLEEQQQPALYLHRLIVRRQWAGWGTSVLDWACLQAKVQAKDWVRIDVWTDNEPLHKYYLRNGFQHVRTLKLDDYPSGALFSGDWAR